MNLLKKLWNSLLKQDNDYYEYTTLDNDLEDQIAYLKQDIYEDYDKYYFFKTHLKPHMTYQLSIITILNIIALKRANLVKLINQRKSFKTQCENCKKIDNIDQSILYAKGIIDTIDQNAPKGIQDRSFANPDGTSKNMTLCADCYSAWFAGNDTLWHEEFESRENININSRESGITHSLNLNFRRN